MSTTDSDLCTVCSKFNLTFRYPLNEQPFNSWLESWGKKRPWFNWEDGDILGNESLAKRSTDDDDDGVSNTESDDEVFIVGNSFEQSEDTSSRIYEITNGSDGHCDIASDNGDDDISQPNPGLQCHSDASSHFRSDTIEDGDQYDSDDLKASSSANDSDEKDITDMKHVHAEIDEKLEQKFLRVLEFLGMDPSEYRMGNPPGLDSAVPRVMRRRKEDNGYSESHDDDERTINEVLRGGRDYVLEQDEDKFESGIRDEKIHHVAMASLKQRWKLETYHTRRRNRIIRKPTLWQMGTVLDIYRRLPCPFCTLVLEFLKPSFQYPVALKQNQFNIDSIPDFAQERVQLELFTGDFVGFKSFLSVGSTDVGYISRKDDLAPAVGNTYPSWLRTIVNDSTPALLETDKFRARLDLCQNAHSICTAIRRATSVDTEYRTIFVDVNRNCLVQGTLGERYLALSYVWGNTLTLQTTKKNLRELLIPGSLEVNDAGLSRVVRDAMTLTRKLRERFLWVDVLCIIQDDVINKSRHISNMDLIYKQAALTIIAHSGTDSDCPIPGLVEHTRFPAVTSRRIAGLEIAACPSSTGDPCISAIYNTRGWTYQEETLSPRRLYIYHTHAHFQCYTSKYFDVMDYEAPIRPGSFLPTAEIVASLQREYATKKSSDPLPFDSENYLQYLEIVQNFSSRRLTHQSDRLNAFSGMLNVLEKIFETPFCNGLPESCLDAALLWSMWLHADRRLPGHLNHDASQVPHGRNMNFPSWSWSGHNYNDASISLILPHIPVRSEIPGFAVLAPGSGELRRIYRSESSSLVDLAKGDRDISQDINPAELSCVALGQNVSVLCFPCRTISDDGLVAKYGRGYPGSGTISTATDVWCGRFYPDDPGISLDHPGGQRRWIILSQGSWGNLEGTNLKLAKRLYNVGNGSTLAIYNIMLVEQRGEAVERLALGWISIHAWPVEKESQEMIYLA